MIPLHDDNPTETTPFFTIALIAGNILVFVYELTLPTLASAQQFVMSFAMIPGEIVSADIRREAVTLFTSMFLHAGIMHLAGNMIYLWIFGNNIEDAVGHIKFLIFYALCGIVAHAAHIAHNPTSTIPTIGASGAVSGILGAYLLLYPRAKVLTLIPFGFFYETVHIPAGLLLVIWFAMQVASGWATGGAGGGVAWWAHIGGFAAGFVLISSFTTRRNIQTKHPTR